MKDSEDTKSPRRGRPPRLERKLVGVRIEPRLVKVMKAIAELHDCALGELLERMFWYNMEGKSIFTDEGAMSEDDFKKVQNLKEVYGVDYDLAYLIDSEGTND